MFPSSTLRLGGLAVAIALAAPLATLQAQSRMVMSNADDGVGSLREAVRLSAADGREITFGNGIGDITLATPLALRGTMRFAGAADGQTRIGGAGLRVGDNGRRDTLYLSGIDFRNGTAVSGGALNIASGAVVIAQDVTFHDNTATGAAAAQGGGAVYNAGYFYAERVTFRNNTATGTSGSGGAIFNAAGGRFDAVFSSFVNNAASRAGGAIEDVSGAGTKVTLFRCTLDSNRAQANPGNGGALHVTGDGDVAVYGGQARGNKASAEGGAFWNGSGKMYFDGAMISGNSANGDNADQGGGGIYNEGGRVIVVGQTMIMDNQAVGAKGSGGGILNGAGGKVELYGTTLNANRAVRAGGAIEDNSGPGFGIGLYDVTARGNRTGGNPGNGGALHITGAGDAEIHRGTFAGNYAAAEGGALWNGTGNMRIRGAMIMNNEAAGPAPGNGGGGIYNNGGTVDIDGGVMIAGNVASTQNGSGGGIFNAPGAKLKIYNSTLRDNTANGVGGAIEDDSGASTVTEIYYSTLTGNQTLQLPGCGGAAHFKGESRGIVVDCDVLDNRATEGGGLWAGAGELMVMGSNILRNVAYGNAATHRGGGGLYGGEGRLEVLNCTVADNRSEGADAYGGGIKQDTKGRTVVRFSTITGNVSLGDGGGIGSDSALEVYNSTIARNTTSGRGGAIFLAIGGLGTPVKNSIFVENNAGGAGDNFFTVTGALILSQGNNLLDEALEGEYQRAPSDIFLGAGQTAGLGDLASNGGRTQTLLPECGSPAIGAGSRDIFGPDQAGNRGRGARRSIGAVERQDDCPGFRAPGSQTEFVDLGQAPNSLTVFPTLVNGAEVTVEVGEDFSEASDLQILDARGQVVRSVRVASRRSTLSVGDLPSGNYFVREVGPSGVRTGRFVVSH